MLEPYSDSESLTLRLRGVKAQYDDRVLYPDPPSGLSIQATIHYFTSLSAMYKDRDYFRELFNFDRATLHLAPYAFPHTHISVADPMLSRYIAQRAQVPSVMSDPMLSLQRINRAARSKGVKPPYPSAGFGDENEVDDSLDMHHQKSILGNDPQSVELRNILASVDAPAAPMSPETIEPSLEDECIVLEDYEIDDIEQQPTVEKTTDTSPEQPCATVVPTPLVRYITPKEDSIVTMNRLLHKECGNSDRKRWLCWDCHRMEILETYERDITYPTLVSSSEEKSKQYLEVAQMTYAPIARVGRGSARELQGDLPSIAADKALIMKFDVKCPVLCDDTGLAVDRLSGLPGPYIKHFDSKMTPASIVEMTGFGWASSQVALAYACHTDRRAVVFLAARHGRIVSPVESGYSYDKYFQYDIADKPTASYNDYERAKMSPRYLAYLAFLDFMCMARITPKRGRRRKC